jgi:hypothetical protein
MDAGAADSQRFLIRLARCGGLAKGFVFGQRKLETVRSASTV